MKIVSILVFAAALIGSWNMVHAKRPVSEAVHMDIQNDLKQIITDYVGQQLPESKNLRFERFWTEVVKKDRVKASFVYSFEDASGESGATTLEVEGSAILNKVSETAELATWSLDELHILDSAISFEEPVQITAAAGELEKTEEPAAPTEDNGHH
jgi:hypothetical protein